MSVMTASYTYSRPARVSAASRRKVLAAAEALGYPGPDPSARSLRRGTSGAVGVVLGEALAYAFDDPEAVRFLAGVADVCGEHGMAMTILPTNGTDGDGQRIRAAAVDCFVVWTTTDDDPVLEALARTGKPVAVHAGPTRSGFGLVGIDDRAAAQAVAQLGLRESRRPAIISFPLTKQRQSGIFSGPDPDEATYPVTRARLLGYRDALAAAGFEWSRIEVAVCPLNSFAQGGHAAHELLSRAVPPDAILAMSDQLGLGALQAAAETGTPVPDSLAVTGWDASEAAAGKFLTTVRQNLREQGAACARAALSGSIDSIRQSWQLVEGRTVRAVAAGA